MSREHIDATIHVMVETDLRGIDSHGIGMLPLYQDWMKAGFINVRPDIRVVRDMEAPLGGTRELGSHKGYGLAMMVEIL